MIYVTITIRLTYERYSKYKLDTQAQGTIVKCKWIGFYYQNCSDLLWEKKNSSNREKLLKFKDEGQEFTKFLRSLKQYILTVKG